MEVPAAGDDGGDTSGAPVHSPPTRGPTAAAAAGPDLTPRLDDERGCFQLGASDHPHQEMFTLTVIVVYAQNLELVSRKPENGYRPALFYRPVGWTLVLFLRLDLLLR